MRSTVGSSADGRHDVKMMCDANKEMKSKHERSSTGRRGGYYSWPCNASSVPPSFITCLFVSRNNLKGRYELVHVISIKSEGQI
jgi:hypothetical protein